MGLTEDQVPLDPLLNQHHFPFYDGYFRGIPRCQTHPYLLCLALSLSLYVYIYIHMILSLSLSFSLHLSLSLCIYIYIFIYIYTYVSKHSCIASLVDLFCYSRLHSLWSMANEIRHSLGYFLGYRCCWSSHFCSSSHVGQPFGDFHSHGGTQKSWMVYTVGSPTLKWMMTGGTPILGHLHSRFWGE